MGTCLTKTKSGFSSCWGGLSRCWDGIGCCQIDFHCCGLWRRNFAKCCGCDCWPNFCTQGPDFDDLELGPKFQPVGLKKRALIACYDYTDDNDRYNDNISAPAEGDAIEEILKSKFSYHHENIVRLDDKSVSADRSTLHVLRDMVEQTQKNETLFFYFSGRAAVNHFGSSDEPDQQDEGIMDPTGRIFSDSQFYNILKEANEGAKIVIILESDASGTLMDLPYHYVKSVEFTADDSDNLKADIVSISACGDFEVANDIELTAGQSTGVFTEVLCGILENVDVKQQTWSQLLGTIEKVFETINSTNQNPQLCTSKRHLSKMNVFM